MTSTVFIKILYALSIGLLLRTSITKVPTSVYTYTESISIDGLSAADRMALSVAMQQRCLPLYGEQSNDKNTPSPLLYTHTHTHTNTLTHTHTHTHTHTLMAVTWLKVGGGKQNRPRVLGTLIYEGVKLESREKLV
jgi:hypothetical protein